MRQSWSLKYCMFCCSLRDWMWAEWAGTHSPYMEAGLWLGLGVTYNCPYMFGCGLGWMPNPAFPRAASKGHSDNWLYLSFNELQIVRQPGNTIFNKIFLSETCIHAASVWYSWKPNIGTSFVLTALGSINSKMRGLTWTWPVLFPWLC